MASSQLTKTFSGNGSATTHTISMWVKRSTIDSIQRLFFTGSGSNQYQLYFLHLSGTYDNLLQFEFYDGSTNYYIRTNRQFKDTSAWYHIVAVWDTTNATSGDRMRLYVNGVRETSFAVEQQPTQNFNGYCNQSTYAHRIGASDTGHYFDGLMTHVHSIDGTAYQASDFGETDSTSGIWKPKTSPSVTHGTNGFFLKFANSASLGLDSSGNTNNFTVSGTGTQTQDTPSNNFAIFNPLAPSASQQTMQNGNLYLPGPNSNNWWQSVPATLGVTKGKWYWEFKDENAWGSTSDSTRRYGICDLNTITNAYSGSVDVRFSDTTSAYAYMNASGVRYNGSTISGTTSTYPTFSPTDIIQIAMDLDNNKLFFGKNGTWLDSSDPAAGTNPVATLSSTATWSPYAEIKYGSDNVSANFGNGYFRTTAVASSNSDGDGIGLFEYSVPTGYYALCTKNIKNYG